MPRKAIKPVPAGVRALPLTQRAAVPPLFLHRTSAVRVNLSIAATTRRPRGLESESLRSRGALSVRRAPTACIGCVFKHIRQLHLTCDSVVRSTYRGPSQLLSQLPAAHPVQSYEMGNTGNKQFVSSKLCAVPSSVVESHHTQPPPPPSRGIVPEPRVSEP